MQTALLTKHAPARIRWANKPEGELKPGLQAIRSPFLCTTQMLETGGFR